MRREIVNKRCTMEFSKKLLFFSWVVTLILTALSIWFSVSSYNTDILSVAMSLSWAETGTATGYYYWKAKNENRAKYAQKFLRECANEWGVETAMRISEIVLKE